jgi:drug/metabolite transporter (DMT)-like permease
VTTFSGPRGIAAVATGERSHPLLAAAWMTGAIFSFTSMAIAGRAVSIELDTFEILLFRSLIGIALVVSVGAALGTLRGIRARRMKWHVARNVSHFTGQNFWFFAITAAPLAQVFALEFSQPIWVALLASFVLGERLTRVRLMVIVTGFLGILIVARPGFSALTPGLIAAAAAAIGFAGSAVTTRHLTRTETVTSILFWLTVMQTVLGVVCAGLDGEITSPSTAAWPWLCVIACAGLFAHLCLTQALSMAPATVVIPLDFARLPVIAIVGMLLYAEPLDGFVFLGAAIILAANYINVWVEARAQQ